MCANIHCEYAQNNYEKKKRLTKKNAGQPLRKVCVVHCIKIAAAIKVYNRQDNLCFSYKQIKKKNPKRNQNEEEYKKREKENEIKITLPCCWSVMCAN